MDTKKFRLWAQILGAVLASALLAGCNTMAGAGEDIEAAGDSLEDAAESKKAY